MSEYTPSVLMVEDNPDVLRLNSRALERAGYAVLRAESLARAEQLLQTRAPDVIVLDILLPDGNGLAFLSKLRSYSDAPVLFLSSLNEHSDVLRGISAGGDDYMTKPYKLDELLVRVSAMWRREAHNRKKAARLAAEPSIVCGALTLDTLSGTAWLQGNDLLLTPKEFSLLTLLARGEGQTFAARQLYQAVWGQPMDGDMNALKTLVSCLRKKLEGSGYAITAQRGEGYVFEQEQ